MELFEDDWGIGNSVSDKTEIVSTLLYFSAQELKLFKNLCKKGIKKEFKNPIEDGNISDLLLIILKEKYENN